MEKNKAKRIERFFLDIFGYCNYDLGRALCRGYGEDVRFEFCIVEEDGEIIAGGVVLKNFEGRVAILGPLGVKEDMRGKGVGRFLLDKILGKLKSSGCGAVYLGVRQESGAVRFYKRMGFENLGGVVMRKVFEKNFEQSYYAKCGALKAREVKWSGWVDAQVVMALSGRMDKFAGLFYDMKIEAEKTGNVIKAVCSGQKVVGLSN